jgi:hypothetical protein
MLKEYHTGLKFGEKPARGEGTKSISGEDTSRSEFTEVGDRMCTHNSGMAMWVYVSMGRSDKTGGHGQMRKGLNTILNILGTIVSRMEGKDFK